jgi:hypothetical protein
MRGWLGCCSNRWSEVRRSQPKDTINSDLGQHASFDYGVILTSMMPSRLSMALVLISTVMMPVDARDLTPQEQANKIHRGSEVMVQMKNRNTVVGRLVEVTQTSFSLELRTPGGSRRNLLFQDVSNIRHIRETPKAVQAIAAVPVLLICGIEWIFNKNSCGDL